MATKAIDPKIKVIVHLDEGNNNARWFFDSAKANKVKYDVIGLSYYPFGLKDYTETIADLENNLKDMASRYKKVMVVEVGGIDEQIENTHQIIATIKAVKKNNKGLGVILGTTGAKVGAAIL
jgi:arabinogalactan endo-1,4-beta-galactosidase